MISRPTTLEMNFVAVWQWDSKKATIVAKMNLFIESASSITGADQTPPCNSFWQKGWRSANGEPLIPFIILNIRYQNFLVEKLPCLRNYFLYGNRLFKQALPLSWVCENALWCTYDYICLPKFFIALSACRIHVKKSNGRVWTKACQSRGTGNAVNSVGLSFTHDDEICIPHKPRI